MYAVWFITIATGVCSLLQVGVCSLFIVTVTINHIWARKGVFV